MEIEEAIQQRKFESSHQRAVINLLYTSSWFSYRQNMQFKEFGLTMPQFNVLRILKGVHPEATTVNAIIDKMIDKSSNASRIVEKLRQKGLVKRKTCKEDRRRVDVFISDKGIKVLEETNASLRASDTISANITEAEADELNRILNKIRSKTKN